MSRPVPTQAALTFLLFLIVTRETSVTGFIPSFCIAFRLFFSPRLCLLLPGVPSSVMQSIESPIVIRAVDIIPHNFKRCVPPLTVVQIRDVVVVTVLLGVILLDLLQTQTKRLSRGAWGRRVLCTNLDLLVLELLGGHICCCDWVEL
jgi:hypothetical protein